MDLTDKENINRFHKVLITGATGFIGRVLCSTMSVGGAQVFGIYRNDEQLALLPIGVNAIQIATLDHNTDWGPHIVGIDTVVHLAARVHVMNEIKSDSLSAFRCINVEGTKRLAEASCQAGVRRFVFLSSIGVNGNVTYGRPFTEEDNPCPHSPYTLSKLEAEQVLGNIVAQSGMELVIIRSPLVYGPGNPGNFLRLLHLIDKGLPLPLGGLQNQRSMIYVENLVDAIITCLKHPNSAGETFLLSDGEDVSTPQLIRMVASAMGKKSRLLSFPPALLNVIGKITGKSAEIKRLTASLQVDSGKIRKMLGWGPPFTVEDGIKETVYWYLDQGK